MCPFYEDFVAENHKQDALRKLYVRINENLEDPEEILGVQDAYYRDKILQGLMPMSYTIYDRIMQCSAEDAKL